MFYSHLSLSLLMGLWGGFWSATKEGNCLLVFRVYLLHYIRVFIVIWLCEWGCWKDMVFDVRSGLENIGYFSR
jgi:hypothetical protein